MIRDLGHGTERYVQVLAAIHSITHGTDRYAIFLSSFTVCNGNRFMTLWKAGQRLHSVYLCRGRGTKWGLCRRLRSDFIFKTGRHGLNHHRRPPPFSPTRATRIASRPRPISRGTPNQAQFIAVARTMEVDSSSPSGSLVLGLPNNFATLPVAVLRK